jgi:putative ABC transport system substrate-binding protein
LLAGAAGLCLARPAAAQQLRLPRLACLSAASMADPVAFVHLRRYLGALGWHDGQNLVLEEHHGNGDAAAVPRMAAAIVAGRPDAIVVTGVTETRAVTALTAATPVVFLQVVDPVMLGVVASLARPGGNVTGVAASGQLLWGKRMEILRELLPPERRRLAVLANAGNPSHARNLEDVARQAPAHGFAPEVLPISQPEDLSRVLAAASSYDAMLVPHDFVLFPRRRQVAGFAAAAGLPAIYENRFSPMVGGMASYGADLRDNYRQGAIYVDRILRGARPADLPVVQPERVELVLNARAIAALGLAATPLLLARADEVIE